MTTEEQQLVERLREGTTIRLSETAATYTPPPKLQIEAADTITRLVEEAAAPPVGALKAIADIREVTGLGAKPMLTELGGGERKNRHRVAHSMKSNARLMGAHDLSKRMAALEARLESENGPDVTADDLTLISRDYELISGPLRAFVGAE